MIEKEARLKVINLSRLEEIKDLRTVWPHEALDFTPWLSQDDNISLLADAVEMDITVDETESSVGDFNVDIFASETGTDRKIIIENQLEDTNHDHLGKLITYASGKSADVVIWVVKHAREEHKAAIEWLNNHTDDMDIYKSDVATVKKIEAAIQAAYEEGESKLKGSSKSVPSLKVLKTPLRDGDLERPDDAAYADSYFINANSASAPGIVDADRQPILERSEVYSGVYGRASINFYAFNSNGNKGIACGLNNLQKIADGEPLGGKSRAEDDFETDDNDDFLS